MLYRVYILPQHTRINIMWHKKVIDLGLSAPVLSDSTELSFWHNLEQN
jgi:hypothetical protein